MSNFGYRGREEEGEGRRKGREEEGEGGGRGGRRKGEETITLVNCLFNVRRVLF